MRTCLNVDTTRTATMESGNPKEGASKTKLELEKLTEKEVFLGELLVQLEVQLEVQLQVELEEFQRACEAEKRAREEAQRARAEVIEISQPTLPTRPLRFKRISYTLASVHRHKVIYCMHCFCMLPLKDSRP